MEINKKEIEHLANLARLSLSEEEKERLTAEMGSILEFAHTLDGLDVFGIDPTMHASEKSNVFREDKAEPSYPTEKILQNAPEADEGCFLMPKAID